MKKKHQRKTGVRHRSPVAPPSKVIDKVGYRRSAEKKRLRQMLREEG